MKLVRLIGVLLVLAPPVVWAAGNEEGVAVIIGNRDYQEIPDVDFAENDANAMRAFIVDVLGYDRAIPESW